MCQARSVSPTGTPRNIQPRMTQLAGGRGRVSQSLAVVFSCRDQLSLPGPLSLLPGVSCLLSPCVKSDLSPHVHHKYPGSASDSVSPFPSAPPPLTLCLSKINKNVKKKKNPGSCHRPETRTLAALSFLVSAHFLSQVCPCPPPPPSRALAPVPPAGL